jgi:hypothetical protein
MFTKRLYQETKDAHQILDKHIFVNLIRTNKEAGELYIIMNKICISYIQKEIQKRLEDPNSNFESFRLLFGKLYKDININIYVSPKMHLLLSRCKAYPLEHAYMFILGLLFGGKLLSKYLPDHEEFLKYDNSKELINEFKDYLDKNVPLTKTSLDGKLITSIDSKIVEHDEFINIVNESYKLINEIFDEYYIKVQKDTSL